MGVTTEDTEYLLFLDDYREISDIFLHNPALNWVKALNYAEFTETIKSKGIPKLVSFDHDLHPEHYNYLHGEFPYDKVKHKTGYHCLEWLIDYCKTNKAELPHIYIHTVNPVGRENMVGLLKSKGYYKNIVGVSR